ncbi:MAG: tRNA (guanosine(37)-N1)-methyltransferase TrmD [Pseudomonadota bacterium]
MHEFIVLTIFPGMISSLIENGVLKHAITNKLISILPVGIRDFATGKHRITDDRPYGGGCGMIMKPEPIVAAINSVKKTYPKAHSILLTPQGRLFTQEIAKELSLKESVILLCGRYEGVDERIREDYIDDEISIGDYVLTGGEPAAIIVIDAVARLIPGVLGSDDSAKEDSFSNGLLEYPHYTRPRSFMETVVPDTLLSGDHKQIRQWRHQASLITTIVRRPDMISSADLSEESMDFLKGLRSRIDDLTGSV